MGDTHARLDDLELRVTALEAESARVAAAQEASRVERDAARHHLAFTADTVLALGERVGRLERSVSSLERRFDATDEMDRLRHVEVMAALQVAARDSTAKGARLDEAESGLARAWRLWGWQTTLIVIATSVANVAAQNVWRIWYVPRTGTVHRSSEGPPLPHGGNAAVSGAGGAR